MNQNTVECTKIHRVANPSKKTKQKENQLKSCCCSWAENHAVPDGSDVASGRATNVDVRRHQGRLAADDELGGQRSAGQRRPYENATDQFLHEHSEHRLAADDQQWQLLLCCSQSGRQGVAVATGGHSGYNLT